MSDEPLFVPESDDVRRARLIARDYGPDVVIVLPREHAIVVGCLLDTLYTRVFEGQEPLDAYDTARAEIIEYAAMTVTRAAIYSEVCEVIARSRARDGRH